MGFDAPPADGKAHSHALRLCRVKIDRSFVRELESNKQDRAIADAIISMGKALGLTVVAEGAETTEQALFLSKHFCDELQG